MNAKELFSLVHEALESEVRDCVALELTRLGENPPEWIYQLVVRETQKTFERGIDWDSVTLKTIVQEEIASALKNREPQENEVLVPLDPTMHIEPKDLTPESALRLFQALYIYYARRGTKLQVVDEREQPIPYPLAPETGLERSKTYFRNWARVRTSVPVRQIDQIFLVVPAPTGSAKMVPRPLVRMSSSAFEPHCLAAVDANPTVWTEVAGRDDCILVGPLPSPNYQFTLEYKERPRGEED